MKWLVGILLPLLVVGCISFVSPYQNFQDIIRAHIGSRIDDPDLLHANFFNPADLVKIVRLPNGHDEYYYKLYYRRRDTCREINEVDPTTRIIVNARWEGTEEDCGIVP
jgi:hypothetical protein